MYASYWFICPHNRQRRSCELSRRAINDGIRLVDVWESNPYLQAFRSAHYHYAISPCASLSLARCCFRLPYPLASIGRLRQWRRGSDTPLIRNTPYRERQATTLRYVSNGTECHNVNTTLPVIATGGT